MTEDRGLSWHFPRTFWTANAIGIALMIIPFSALSVALAPKLGGASLSIASMQACALAMETARGSGAVLAGSIVLMPSGRICLRSPYWRVEKRGKMDNAP